VEAWVISDWGVAVYMFLYLWRKLGPPAFHFGAKYLLKLSSPLYLAAISLFLYSSFDQLTLIPLGSLTALGIYGATVTAFNAYFMLISLLSTVFLPVISGEHGVRGPEVLGDSIRSASRYISIIAMPLAFVLLATARPALTLFVGTSYQTGAIPLAILALGSVASIVATPLTPTLIVLNETVSAALASIIPIPISVAVAIISIPILGISGASIARALSMLLSLMLTYYFLRRKIAVTLDSQAIGKTVVASVCMALVTQAVQFLYYSRYLLPAYLLIACLTYLLALRALKAVRPTDLELLRRMIGPRSNRICDLLSRLVIPK